MRTTLPVVDGDDQYSHEQALRDPSRVARRS
jgi:hypothetical protein